MKRLALCFLVVFFLGTPSRAQTSGPSRSANLSLQRARHSENWVRDGIIYEIYVRSFSPAGNFAGVEERLPELKKLGVTILWIMPIHPVGVLHRKGTLGSPYSVQDYYGINPEFGTLDDFKRLLKRAHALGFHLVIDLVANHTAWDSKLIKEHPEWFTKDSAGNIIPPNPDWTDVADLNYSEPGLRRYMITMMKYWVRDVGIDGFRCDVAELVPIDFWNEARTALDSIKPVMMLAEGSRPEEHLKAFDLSYSWNIYPLLGPLVHGQSAPSLLDSELTRERGSFPGGSLRMRFSSNHDENAWDSPDVVKLGKDGAMLAAVLVNTLPGVPLLYNGQEVGNGKKLRLFEKDSIDWSDNQDYRNLYESLFSMRAHHPSLSRGEMIRLTSSDDAHLYAFARISGSDRLLVVLNFGSVNFDGAVSLPSGSVVSSRQFLLEDLFTGESRKIDLPAPGRLPLSVPPLGYRVFSVGTSPH